MRAIRGSLRRLLCNCSTSAWDMLARTSPTAEEAHMKGRLCAVAGLSVCVALTACGGTSKVSSASLQPRLLPSSNRKSTRLNSSHVEISYAVFCLKKKKKNKKQTTSFTKHSE